MAGRGRQQSPSVSLRASSALLRSLVLLELEEDRYACSVWSLRTARRFQRFPFVIVVADKSTEKWSDHLDHRDLTGEAVGSVPIAIATMALNTKALQPRNDKRSEISYVQTKRIL